MTQIKADQEQKCRDKSRILLSECFQHPSMSPYEVSLATKSQLIRCKLCDGVFAVIGGEKFLTGGTREILPEMECEFANYVAELHHIEAM